MGYVDLHSHSNFSDGSLSPEQLVELARKIGLRSLALTDHNTVAGLPRFLMASRSTSVEGVPGAEFSTEHNGREVHLLGLFIPENRYADVEDYVSVLAQRKKKSNRALEQALQDAGYDIHLDEMMAGKPADGQINRADFAAALEQKGYMSREEAFASVLKREQGLYHPPRLLDSMETIEFIRSIGAVPVLAHPYLSLEPYEVREFLQEGRKHGLIGMETYYSTYDAPTTKLAESTAAEFGMLPSGGSDFHGAPKPEIELGRGRGDLSIPLSILEALRASA